MTLRRLKRKNENLYKCNTLEQYSYLVASDEYSWTKVRTYRTSNIFADDVTYYNGLGYPVEVRSVDHTAGYDLGTALTYDALMREPRKWLPVPYEDLGYTESEWAEAFLPAEDGILSYYQEQYGTEPDPDDDPVPVRPFSETHSEFSPSGRPLSTSLPGEQYYLHPTSYNYLAATIDGRNVVGVKTTDGDGRVSVEWKDYEGRLVAEDRQISGSPARTLYRYDWRGNLTEVITPEGNTYSYSYDSRSRVISKTIPGKEAETFTYDALDRIITSQDGNQREGGVTILYQYDNVGNLTFKKARQGNVSRTMEEHTYNANTGLKTSEKFYKLTADGWVSGTDYLSRTYTYDNEERVISVAETDYPQSYSLTTGYAYDLQGNVTSTTETCVKSNVTLAVTTERGYDSRSRPTLETVKIGNSTKSTVSYTYDDLGRLYGKYYGTGTNRITESSGYDIHGWLTSRGGNLLTQGYGYENTSSPSWVGNITKWDWHHVATVAEGTSYATKSESFTYDALNRLTGSAMTSGGQSAGNAWSERNISYDLDGNLLHLDRYQDVSATPNTTLSFTYSGNHRTGYGYDDNGNITYDPLRNFEIKYNLLNLISEVSVPGARNNPDTELSNTVFYADGTRAGVKDPATGNWTSRYIGSLIYKGVNGQESLEGIQTADGFIDCSSGVSNAQMQYFLRDHLGSVRVIASDKNTVVSRTDYLPFGVRMTGNGLTESTTARSAWFGFSGKENELWNAQSSTSHWVRGERYQHFGARYYDPVACSWTGVDPLAEKYPGITPYAYCAGDPVNYVDPDGKDIAILKKKRGQHIALLIQQKNESNNLVWKYYSVNGDNIYNLRGEHTGGRLFDDLGEHEFDTVQDFLDSDFNQEGSKYDTSIAGYIYDKAYVIETDINHIQDDLAAEEFRKASDENYRLAFPVNHCATAVQRSLDAAGINNAIELRIPTNPSISIQSVYYHPYLPSLAYKAIKSLNPDGKELFRSH